MPYTNTIHNLVARWPPPKCDSLATTPHPRAYITCNIYLTQNSTFVDPGETAKSPHDSLLFKKGHGPMKKPFHFWLCRKERFIQLRNQGLRSNCHAGNRRLSFIVCKRPCAKSKNDDAGKGWDLWFTVRPQEKPKLRKLQGIISHRSKHKSAQPLPAPPRPPPPPNHTQTYLPRKHATDKAG